MVDGTHDKYAMVVLSSNDENDCHSLHEVEVKEAEKTLHTNYRNADMRRLKLSTKANRAFSIWSNLETVTAPIAICVAKSDALHAHDDALKIAEILPNGEVVEVPSNQFMKQT